MSSTFCFNFTFTVVVMFAEISIVLFLLLNKLSLCFADFNFEAARENTLPYSAWKCREGGPESIRSRGKLISRLPKTYFLNQLLSVSNGVLPKHTVFCQSLNTHTVCHIRDFCICVIVQAFLTGLKRAGLGAKMWCHVWPCTYSIRI